MSIPRGDRHAFEPVGFIFVLDASKGEMPNEDDKKTHEAIYIIDILSVKDPDEQPKKIGSFEANADDFASFIALMFDGYRHYVADVTKAEDIDEKGVALSREKYRDTIAFVAVDAIDANGNRRIPMAITPTKDTAGPASSIDRVMSLLGMAVPKEVIAMVHEFMRESLRKSRTEWLAEQAEDKAIKSATEDVLKKAPDIANHREDN